MPATFVGSGHPSKERPNGLVQISTDTLDNLPSGMQTYLRLMTNPSILSWQNVKMYWFNHRESVLIEYINQFNHVTEDIWTDSINSQENLKWFNQINQSTQYIMATLTVFRKTFGFVDLMLFKWIELIQSYQSMKFNRLNHLPSENELSQSPINSLGEGTESIQSILGKNESNQINQLNRVDRYTSLLLCRTMCWAVPWRREDTCNNPHISDLLSSCCGRWKCVASIMGNALSPRVKSGASPKVKTVDNQESVISVSEPTKAALSRP